MEGFKDQMRVEQIHWRRQALSNQERGKQNTGFYDHVLPITAWELNLWPGINSESTDSLPWYLKAEKIKRHTGSHNLLSSWILCANLYFPFRREDGKQLLTGFLRNTISQQIEAVTCVELEYESGDKELRPGTLLGETSGGRGANQTSPDVGFEIETVIGPGVILVECKFTEHHFYRCSGRKVSPKDHSSNPDPTRCEKAAAILQSPDKQCHLCTWGRQYWKHLNSIADSKTFSTLTSCPAAHDGYQLFRQQALAEGMAKKLAFVVSAVAYDRRNDRLMTCMARSTGLTNIKNDWSKLFPGKAQFATFTHQEWVSWVAKHNQAGTWNNWLQYVRRRYAL
jgi:hypothetical protein